MKVYQSNTIANSQLYGFVQAMGMTPQQQGDHLRRLVDEGKLTENELVHIIHHALWVTAEDVAFLDPEHTALNDTLVARLPVDGATPADLSDGPEKDELSELWERRERVWQEKHQAAYQVRAATSTEFQRVASLYQQNPDLFALIVEPGRNLYMERTRLDTMAAMGPLRAVQAS